MFTNSKNLVKIGPWDIQLDMPIFAVLSKNLVVTVIIFGVTVPVFVEFAQYVAKILPLNIFESELWYSKQFQNASLPNEGQFVNFA